MNGQPQGEGPIRTCCICRRRLPKAELLRHVRSENDDGVRLVPDPRGKMPGRGLYVCDQAECRERFLRYGDRRKKR
ncbi:MAG: YlxR family protein [Humidesulfovibrio sp.]|nr:YlxR family protein [Humidesulfovibrio sp.]